MSYETVKRDLGDAMANARRTATDSVSFLKGKGSDVSAPMPESFSPANETFVTPALPDPGPSIISVNVEMKGTLSTSGDMRIYGVVEGNITASTITICAGGVVKGDLTGETIIIHGAVKGHVSGQDVRLCAGALVDGEISHGSLGIDTAAIFEGSVKRIQKNIAAPVAVGGEAPAASE